MLDSYRKTEAWNYDAFLAAHIAVLCEFEADTVDAVTDLGKGLRSRSQWPPDAAEVRKACEEFEGPRKRALQRDMALAKQLDERRLIEHQRAAVPKQTVELHAEMQARGFVYDKTGKIIDVETPNTVRDKFGLTQEQWDAIPNGPLTEWKKGQLASNQGE